MEPNWFIDQMDSIHIMVHHLAELGLRVPKEAAESDPASEDEEEDEASSSMVDRSLKRLVEVIESKRAIFTTDRLDGADSMITDYGKYKVQTLDVASNTKFTLLIDEPKMDDGL